MVRSLNPYRSPQAPPKSQRRSSPPLDPLPAPPLRPSSMTAARPSSSAGSELVGHLRIPPRNLPPPYPIPAQLLLPAPRLDPADDNSGVPDPAQGCYGNGKISSSSWVGWLRAGRRTATPTTSTRWRRGGHGDVLSAVHAAARRWPRGHGLMLGHPLNYFPTSSLLPRASTAEAAVGRWQRLWGNLPTALPVHLQQLQIQLHPAKVNESMCHYCAFWLISFIFNSIMQVRLIRTSLLYTDILKIRDNWSLVYLATTQDVKNLVYVHIYI